MKKYRIFNLLLLFLICLIFVFCGFKSSAEINNDNNQADVVNQQITEESADMDVWCVTFQLIWNDFMDKFMKSQPVQFEEGNPKIADELNKRLYTTDVISSDSYYKTYGLVSKNLKNEIQKSIKKKFKENSDVLDKINWNAKNTYLFYVMLKKDFTFLSAFDVVPAKSFNGSNDLYKYFGVNSKSNSKLRKNVNVLFYKSSDEFAVKLLTNEQEEVILYRTDKKDSFENIYDYVVSNSNIEHINKQDVLSVPNLNVDKLISYDELCNKKIVGSKYVISQALQTIKFKMDNKGGTLKSEAAMTIMRMSLGPVEERLFNFDKPFVLFLKEQNSDKPYYAMYVDDTKYLVKE